MQQKNQNSPNPKHAPGKPSSDNPRSAQPKENFPGKAPDVYGDDRQHKGGQSPNQNPKRDSDHDSRRSAKQNQNPDDQHRDQRQDPARRDERA
ncbi:MAG: hypothetical protein WD044_05515, partial [Dongiaceae bacterium]